YRLFPGKWSLDNLYNRSLTIIDRSANKVTTVYMTGYLRDYFRYIFLFFILVLGGLLLYLDVFHLDVSGDKSIGVFELVMAITIMIAGVTLLFAKTRLTAIIVNGYIGFTIALFFVLFRAPDLALTQLVVETVTTALFLLCFYFLPDWEVVKEKFAMNWTNLVISICVGSIFTAIALSINSGRLFESISVFFEDAYELAGAKNIVNTIRSEEHTSE